MLPNPQFPADLVTFTEKILNGKLDSFIVFNNTDSFTFENNLGLQINHKKVGIASL